MQKSTGIAIAVVSGLVVLGVAYAYATNAWAKSSIAVTPTSQSSIAPGLHTGNMTPTPIVPGMFHVL